MKKTLLSLLMIAALFSTSQSQTLQYQIVDKSFSAGDTVYAEFRCYGFVDMLCHQFAFKCDTSKIDLLLINGSPLEYTGNLPSMDDGDFSWYGKWPNSPLVPGELRNAWSNWAGNTVANGLVLFKVRLKAKQAGSLSSSFTLWSNHPTLKPRAYRKPLVSIPFELVYVSEAEGETTATTDHATELMQVWPNPFKDTFNVGIPESVKALRLYDLNSVLLWEFNTGICPGKVATLKSEAPAGLYFLEAMGENGVMFVKQLIKQ